MAEIKELTQRLDALAKSVEEEVAKMSLEDKNFCLSYILNSWIMFQTMVEGTGKGKGLQMTAVNVAVSDVAKKYLLGGRNAERKDN